MGASVGVRLVMTGHHVGERAGEAEILELHGPSGTPPWLSAGSGARRGGFVVRGPDAARTPSRDDSRRSG